MVKKYKHHGHPFQKWFNTTLNKHGVRPEAISAMSGLKLASIHDWKRGASLPKLVSFWALCRTFAVIERTSPSAINVLPLFNGDTRDPSEPVWR